jgi:short-subunit dehydrogenase
MSEKKRNLFIVTGVSKGFGKVLCLQLLEFFVDVDYILISRDTKANLETKHEIQEKSEKEGKIVNFQLFSIDLANLDELEIQVQKIFDTVI